MNTELTTLCYLETKDSYLMLHRVKKQNDENHDKYIGVGGHLEAFETPEECALREIKEETGLTANSLKLRGLLTFVIDDKTELAWLYTTSDFSGNMITCNEGNLEWIPKADILKLPLWEGDRIFLKLLKESEKYFSLKLVYRDGALINTVQTI